MTEANQQRICSKQSRQRARLTIPFVRCSALIISVLIGLSALDSQHAAHATNDSAQAARKAQPHQARLHQRHHSPEQSAEPTENSDAPIVQFWLFGGIAILAAALTITRRNPVTSALFLVLTLFCTGGLFLVMNATFLAAIQVLVYAGAVMVLFVFVVMSVDNYDNLEFGFVRDFCRGWWSKLAAIFALSLCIIIPFTRIVETMQQTSATAVSESFGDVRSLGRLLFTDYLFPFEAISLLLLVSIVGAIMVSRRPDSSDTTSNQGI